eukprot:TRINITY_DN11975_c0_g1_i1.p1 TRINITY_DN11975_c0_g1~~TRINITY_DN11975_c0_g1_i1.p1  ORF type:complete len:524 (+),score=95.33 TRINITY_DN11975_c0_g1_i1:41-1573(+)
MTTAAELQALIAVRKEEVQQAQAETLRSRQEVDEALARQKLRRELEAVQKELDAKKNTTAFWKHYRQNIDRDESGDYLPDPSGMHPPLVRDGQEKDAVKGHVDCAAAVGKGEIDWSIEGFSWLRESLKQMGVEYLESPVLTKFGHTFQLRYHPDRGSMSWADEHNDLRGSLAIFHQEPAHITGVTFRYSMWVKSKDGHFVQWGDTARICITQEDTDCMIFGPDVCVHPEIPAGVFGMSHSQLTKSEWVIDDALSVKVKLEVRHCESVLEEEEKPQEIIVPASKLDEELLALLDSGMGSDVVFIVEGQEIRAHSVILSARSEVLQTQLNCGMKESASKTITIVDCEPETFKAFLRYLYSDSFACLKNFIAEKLTDPSPNTAFSSRPSSSSPTRETQMSMLQQLLAVSHKYQLTRLQLWCERELSSFISVEDACSVLCQAHLYESKQLEKRCLEFIKMNLKEVVKTDAFASLSRAWPQAALKLTLHAADIDEGAASMAMDKQRCVHKRKRED